MAANNSWVTALKCSRKKGVTRRVYKEKRLWRGGRTKKGRKEADR